MPAPKRANTAAASDARRRVGDRAAAMRLRDAGWIVLPPDVVATLPALVYRQIRAAMETGGG